MVFEMFWKGQKHQQQLLFKVFRNLSCVSYTLTWHCIKSKRCLDIMNNMSNNRKVIMSSYNRKETVEHFLPNEDNLNIDYNA